MNKKIILSVVVVVLIIAAAIAVVRFSTDEDTWICNDHQWIKHGSPDKPMPQTGCGEKQNNNEVEINFSKVGNITNFDTKTNKETQAWYFLYEEPGAPAISKILVPTSGCKYYYLNGDNKSCLDAGGEFYNGQRVKIDGQITVHEINAVKIYEQSITQTDTQIANPASVYCKEQGGTLKIQTAADGSQSGLCTFSEGRQCDEWNFFRSRTCVSN